MKTIGIITHKMPVAGGHDFVSFACANGEDYFLTMPANNKMEFGTFIEYNLVLETIDCLTLVTSDIPDLERLRGTYLLRLSQIKEQVLGLILEEYTVNKLEEDVASLVEKEALESTRIAVAECVKSLQKIIGILEEQLAFLTQVLPENNRTLEELEFIGMVMELKGSVRW